MVLICTIVIGIYMKMIREGDRRAGGGKALAGFNRNLHCFLKTKLCFFFFFLEERIVTDFVVKKSHIIAGFIAFLLKKKFLFTFYYCYILV